MSEESSQLPPAESEPKKVPRKKAPAKTESNNTPEPPAASQPDAPDTADTPSRPPVKRGVRVAKTATAKKSAPQKEPTEETPSDTPNTAADTNQRKNPRKQGRRGRSQQEPRQQDAPKGNLNSKTVAKRAWKIFLGEVNEEGLALIADKDARELARRSLRVAEIYCREEATTLQTQQKGKGKKKKASQKSSKEPSQK